ncbi:MAG TPA: thioredoxin family protein, partial [Pirellulales bacterium]|nr:thioredoxin family protein [Pirellulales bacterium]
VKIQKLVRAKGQFVDRAGRPLYSTQFYYGPLVREHNETAPWLGCFGGHLTCDEDGNFILNDLVVGGRYRIVNAQNHQTATMLAVDQRSPFDAGKVIVRNGTPGPTAEQEIARLCLADPTKAYERAKQEAARRHQRVLVLIVDPQAASTRQLVDFRLRYKDVRLAADNFNMLIVEAAGKQAAPFLRALDLPPTPGEAWTQLVVRTAEGAPVTDAWLPEVSTDGQIDRARLLAWLRAHSPPVPDAQQLLDDALAEARQSGRRVLVLQTAVWCHPSNLLQDYLESQRAVLDQDFVSVQIDERWANIQAAIARIRPKSNGIGLPWLAALDADGHLLSMLQGYPNRETFQDLLQASAQRLSPDEMEALLSALVQKPTVKKSSSIRGTIHPKQAE